MQLPVVSRPTIQPMYTWPRSLKRLLLLLSVLAVLVAYALLGGGIIALLALLTDMVG